MIPAPVTGTAAAHIVTSRPGRSLTTASGAGRAQVSEDLRGAGDATSHARPRCSGTGRAPGPGRARCTTVCLNLRPEALEDRAPAPQWRRAGPMQLPDPSVRTPAVLAKAVLLWGPGTILVGGRVVCRSVAPGCRRARTPGRAGRRSSRGADGGSPGPRSRPRGRPRGRSAPRCCPRPPAPEVPAVPVSRPCLGWWSPCQPFRRSVAHLRPSPSADRRPELTLRMHLSAGCRSGVTGRVQPGEDCLHPAVAVRRVSQPELAEDASGVGLDGLLAHVHRGGDRPVRPALGDQREHLPLPHGQGGRAGCRSAGA